MSTDSSRAIWSICVALFVFGALIRLGYVGAVLVQDDPAPDVAGHVSMPSLDEDDALPPYMTPDTRSYLRPARDILEGDVLDAGTTTRPPGYPLFLAALGLNPTLVLITQALLGSLLPVVTLFIVRELTDDTAMATVAGVTTAVLPSGVGLVALMTPDLLLAVSFVSGLLFLLLAARRERSGWLTAAGAAWAVALLLKPVMLLWLPVAVLVAWLLGGRGLRFAPRRALVLFVLLQLLPAMLWSVRNLAREGTLTYSLIGLSTARVYWLAKAELLADASSPLSPRDLEAHQRELRARLFDSDGSPTAVREEAVSILRRHPRAALLSFGQNVMANTEIGWDRFPVQLRSFPRVADALGRLARLEGASYRLGRWLLLFTPLLILLLRRRRVDPRSWDGAVALWLSAMYFVGLSGLTFWTGPRIVFPAILTSLALLFVLASAAGDEIRGRMSP